MTSPTYPAPKTATLWGEALTAGVERTAKRRPGRRLEGGYEATRPSGRRPLAIATMVSLESRSSSVFTTQ